MKPSTRYLKTISFIVLLYNFFLMFCYAIHGSIEFGIWSLAHLEWHGLIHIFWILKVWHNFGVWDMLGKCLDKYHCPIWVQHEHDIRYKCTGSVNFEYVSDMDIALDLKCTYFIDYDFLYCIYVSCGILVP